MPSFTHFHSQSKKTVQSTHNAAIWFLIFSDHCQQLTSQPGIYSKAVGSCLVGFGDIQPGPEEIHKVVRLPPEVSSMDTGKGARKPLRHRHWNMCHASNCMVRICEYMVTYVNICQYMAIYIYGNKQHMWLQVDTWYYM